MKLLIKKLSITCVAICTAALTVPGQANTIPLKFDHKNKIYVGYEWVDTLRASAAKMQQVRTIQHATLLNKDHYYYDFPFVHNIGVRFTGGKEKSEIYEGLNWGGEKFFKSIIIKGDCAIELAAVEINEENAAFYQYHVVQNDSTELVKWSHPSVFKYTSDGKLKYAYLGRFDYVPGQVLKIEIYDTRNYKRVDAMIIDWRKVERAQISPFMQYYSRVNHLPDNGVFSKDLDKADMGNDTKTLAKYIYVGKKRRAAIEDSLSKDIRFHLADSLQDIDFFINNGGKSYNYKIELQRVINGHADTIHLGETNTRFDLYKVFWDQPGKYKISFIPKIHKHGGMPIYLLDSLATTFNFTVLPARDHNKTIPVKKFFEYLAAIIFFAVVVVVFYRVKQRQQLAKERTNKQIATQQLQAVRAQLNPHFVFNALAGIQNLMNKNEVENANKYLARFARLTRNVLEDSNKELVTIEHEIDMLNDYLLMEQTRFGFNFTIDAEEANIDQQVEIPAMLLQPFVENAVKHGVSALGKKGEISVKILSKGDTLLLTVQDNGSGFIAGPQEGMGVKLCEERIKLLNSVYRKSIILLHTLSDNKGTLITIELKHWL